MRTVLGILVGALVAAGVLYGFGYWLQQLHPLPVRFDARSARALAEYVDDAPQGGLWVIATASGAAALLGAWFAAAIARGHRGAAALMIAAPLTVLVIVSAALVPQPDWVPILGMLLPIPLAVAAWRVALPRREL